MATHTHTVPLSNEETDKAFTKIKTEMNAALTAGERGDVARSEIISTCIHLAAHSPSFASELFARSASVFLSKKDHATESEGAWNYFVTLYGLPARINAEAEPDRHDRERHNNKVSASQQFVRYAASIYYAIGTANAWTEFTRGKNKGVVMLTIAGAKALYPKRAASLDKSEYNVVAITHRAGEYRFSSIAEQGKALLEAKGIKAKSENARAKPVRDVLKDAWEAAENSDSKAFDNETRRIALASLVAQINALNDKTVKDHLDSDKCAPFLAHLAERLAPLDKANDDSKVKAA